MQLLTHHNLTRTLLSLLFGSLLVMGAFAPISVSGEVNNEDQPASYEQCTSSVWDALSINCLAAHVANAMLTLTGIFTSLAGLLLNWSIVNTVTLMGEHVNGIAGLTLAWTVLRDFANLVFIFALVFISIATILRIERYGYKQLLKNLIIVAILINFSLVITKVVIDTSNLFATSIYHNILFQSGGEAVDCTVNIQSSAESGSPCLSQGLSAIFMDLTRITTLYSGQGGVLAALDFLKIMVVGFFGSIFLLITAFIFLSAAILLIIRYVVLIFLMILSPLAFAAYVLPQTQGYASKWWKTLLSQSFFAPFYFLLIWVTVVLMTSSSSAIVGDETLSFSEALLKPDVDAKEIILNFFIISALMIASLVIAKNMGAYGAGRLQGIGKSLTGWATAGTVGLASAKTLKRYDRAMARLDRAASDPKRGAVTRKLFSAANKSMKGFGIDYGISESLKAGKEAKFFGARSYKDRDDWTKARGRSVKGTQREIESEEAVKTARDTHALSLRAAAPGFTPTAQEQQLLDKRQEALGSLRRLTRSEIEDIGAKAFKDPTVARHLSHNQLDALRDSEKITAQDRKDIGDAKIKHVTDAINSGSQASVQRELENMSPAEVIKLGESKLSNPVVAASLSNDHLRAIYRDRDITRATREKIYDAFTTPGLRANQSGTDYFNSAEGQSWM